MKVVVKLEFETRDRVKALNAAHRVRSVFGAGDPARVRAALDSLSNKCGFTAKGYQAAYRAVKELDEEGPGLMYGAMVHTALEAASKHLAYIDPKLKVVRG